MSSLISYRNWVDDPSTTIEFNSGELADPAYPLDNLRTRQLSTVARWSLGGAGGAVALMITFAGPRRVDVVGLLGLNFRQANHVAGMAVHLEIDGNWVEPYTTVDNQDRGVPELPYNLVAPIPRLPDGSAPIATRVRIVAEWDATGVDFSQAARLWIGPGIFFADGIDAGWGMAPIESGKVDESIDKQAYEDPRPRVRAFDVSLQGIETATAWGFDEGDVVADDVPSINGLQMAAGQTGNVLFVARTTTPVWVRRTAVYARLSAAAKLTHVTAHFWNVAFPLIEER